MAEPNYFKSSSTEGNGPAHAPSSVAGKTRIVVAGGGFGGVYTASHLEKLFARRPDVEVVLVSSDNFMLMTPLLFEACSGTLQLHHVSVPTRAFLRRTRFVEATMTSADLERRVVRATTSEGRNYDIPYDQLVLALGATTNRSMILGSQHAFTFKTLADALYLRNHIIERFERADLETDPANKRNLLTFVVIGGGLVGVELFGELTAFADEIIRFYRHVKRDEIRFVLLQAAEHILPELDPKLANYAVRILSRRQGAEIRTHTVVQAIEPGRVRLAGETIEAGTIVLAAGIVPSPGLAHVSLEKDHRGRVVAEATMRCRGHSNVWALGDCASIPGPDGKPYPALAQHAIRQARVLAANIQAVLNGGQPQPFVYHMLGTMASLGHCVGLGSVFGMRIRGVLAWWLRRSYYLWQMPGFGRQLKIVIDWTLALAFRPDITKIDLATEYDQLTRNTAAGGESTLARSDGGTSTSPLPAAAASAPEIL